MIFLLIHIVIRHVNANMHYRTIICKFQLFLSWAINQPIVSRPSTIKSVEIYQLIFENPHPSEALHLSYPNVNVFMNSEDSPLINIRRADNWGKRENSLCAARMRTLSTGKCANSAILSAWTVRISRFTPKMKINMSLVEFRADTLAVFSLPSRLEG